MFVKKGIEIRPHGPSSLISGKLSEDVVKYLIDKKLAKQGDFQKTDPKLDLTDVQKAIQKANEAEAERLKAAALKDDQVAAQDKKDEEAAQRLQIQKTTDDLIERARVEAIAELKAMEPKKPKRKATRTK